MSSGAGSLLKVTGLYQNKSNKSGETYLVGYWGNAKILILKNKDAKTNKDPKWIMFLTERPQKQQQRQSSNQLQERRGSPDDTDPLPFNDPVPEIAP